jgi:hypothetical protein
MDTELQLGHTSFSTDPNNDHNDMQNEVRLISHERGTVDGDVNPDVNAQAAFSRQVMARQRRTGKYRQRCASHHAIRPTVQTVSTVMTSNLDVPVYSIEVCLLMPQSKERCSPNVCIRHLSRSQSTVARGFVAVFRDKEAHLATHNLHSWRGRVIVES